MQWSYELAPVGGHQRLAAGSFDAPNIEAAKRHAQTVIEPSVAASADVDVRLLDRSGTEVWRGPYVGPHEKMAGGANA